METDKSNYSSRKEPLIRKNLLQGREKKGSAMALTELLTE